jgi:hypothetical protein
VISKRDSNFLTIRSSHFGVFSANSWGGTESQRVYLQPLSDSELKILASVKEYFKTFSAKKITEFSHKEKGYTELPQGRLISYAYADELKI